MERRSAIISYRADWRTKKYDLVDLRSAVPSISIDLRYATSRNVAGHAVYPSNMPCLVRSSTAQRLRKAQQILQEKGYGLRIWDAWRPPEAQVHLHRHSHDADMFINPKVGWSRHCGGTAVDATLVDANGVEQRMPTYFDEDLAKASTYYEGTDPIIYRNLNLLHGAMKQAGLLPLDAEWWHFDDKDYLHRPQPVVYGRDLGIYIYHE